MSEQVAGKSPLLDGRAYLSIFKTKPSAMRSSLLPTFLILMISLPFIKNCNERFSFGRLNNNGLVEQVAALH